MRITGHMKTINTGATESMHGDNRSRTEDLIFSDDNSANMKQVISRYKNILVCGIKGVGKITHSLDALVDSKNVHYIGNPVDFEGKKRPGSYDQYVQGIQMIKNDIHIVKDISRILKLKIPIVLIIDEIYGRSDKQREQLSKIFDMPNVQCIQIVGCMKYMRDLIKKIDFIIVLEPVGAFTTDKKFGEAVCRILGED